MKFLVSVTVSLLMVFSLYSVSGCKQQPAGEARPAAVSQPAEEEIVMPPAGAGMTVSGAGLLNSLNEALANVAEEVKPSVVNISTTKTVSMRENPLGDLFNDPFFKKFFGDQFNPHGGDRKYKTSALGSGVIVTEDGYILTNNHVVQGVDEIKVILPDKREFPGKLIGTDPKTDVAVIKIKADKLPAIKIGNSGTLKVGELVIAIGNPFGLGSTITMGIVSAIGRSHVGIADYEDFIQTDAAINPGNSGGALVNIHGELVGINTAIFSTSGGNVGIGFAVPSTMTKSVMNSIIAHGKVVRGWLGVSIQDITPELSIHFDIKENKGALVADVFSDSPADKAGVKRGDLIVALGGENVADTTSLRNMVAGKEPGTTVQMNIIRNGEEMVLTVKLGEMSVSEAAPKSTEDTVLQGVYVQGLTPDIRSSLGMSDSVTGVIVTNVEADSPSSDVLKRNDVIQEINKKRISSVDEFKEAVSKIKKGDSVLLLVYRAGGYIYVTINP